MTVKTSPLHWIIALVLMLAAEAAQVLIYASLYYGAYPRSLLLSLLIIPIAVVPLVRKKSVTIVCFVCFLAASVAIFVARPTYAVQTVSYYLSEQGIAVQEVHAVEAANGTMIYYINAIDSDNAEVHVYFSPYIGYLNTFDGK